jgi:RNA polymerase sigma-70 factor (ECF subfamily)
MASEKHPQQPMSLAQTAATDYGAELQRYLMRRLRDAQNARDLAQEVYLRLLRVGSGEHVQDRRAYLYRIASHVVYEFRMRARQALVSFDSEAVDEWAEHAADASADNLNERVTAPPDTWKRSA